MFTNEEHEFNPQPAKVRFINKKGQWKTETCHDINSCYEHKQAIKETQKTIKAKLDNEAFVKTLPLGVNRKTGKDSNSAVHISIDEYAVIELIELVTGGNLTEEQLLSMLRVNDTRYTW